MQSKPRKIELFLFLLVLFIALTSIYYLGASITAFIIKELGYEQKLNLVITSNGNYTWYIENIGDLKSLKIDGSITHYGKAKVYLESKGIKYLILDTTKLNNTNFSSISLTNQTNLITAFVVKDNKNKTIDKNEKPKWSSGVNEFVVNDTTKINLSEHFTDDDNDSLSYSVSQAEGLSTFLEHEILIITPTATENLNTTINLTASDGIDNKTKEIGLIIIVSIGQNETINLTPITNKTRFITIALDYKSGTAYDEDDDGKESINGVIDLSIENTYFNWDVDKNKLCTRWEVYNLLQESSTMLCYGNEECCSFLDLIPSRSNWSDIYYSNFGKDNAGYSNIVSARVVYYDVNLSLEAPKFEIYYSEFGNKSVSFFEEETKFLNICLDTCTLSGLNKSSYTLIFEIEDNAILRIDKIKYDMIVDIRNNPPILVQNFTNVNISKNKNISIDLAQYFNEQDGDTLTYEHYKADNITILFENNIATVLPDKNFEGIRYIYITANDSENIAISNIFMINVSEAIEEITPRVEIGKPVRWINRFFISISNSFNLTLPQNAFNISVRILNYTITNELTKEKLKIIENNQVKDKDIFELEKRISNINKKINIFEELKSNVLKVIVDENKFEKNEFGLKLNELYNEKLELEQELNQLLSVNNLLTSNIIVFNETITNQPILFINESLANIEIEVEYYTEAPIAIETEINSYTKQIKVISETPYNNVVAYVDLNDVSQQAIKLYWIENNTKILFDKIEYFDANNNGLVDRIEWIIPHLSNQTFEVSITILNVQSYPTLFDNWTVAFNTTGTGNLTIMASNGTDYAEKEIDDLNTINDLDALELRCTNNVLEPLYIVDLGNLSLEGAEISGDVVNNQKISSPKKKFFANVKENKNGLQSNENEPQDSLSKSIYPIFDDIHKSFDEKISLESTSSSARNLSFDINKPFASQPFSSIVQSSLDMLFGQGGISLNDFIISGSTFHHLQNLPEHNSSVFESGLSMTNFAVCNNIFVNFDSHSAANNKDVFKCYANNDNQNSLNENPITNLEEIIKKEKTESQNLETQAGSAVLPRQKEKETFKYINLSTRISNFFSILPSVQALHIGSGTYNTIIIDGKVYALLTKEQLQEHYYKLIENNHLSLYSSDNASEGDNTSTFVCSLSFLSPESIEQLSFNANAKYGASLKFNSIASSILSKNSEDGIRLISPLTNENMVDSSSFVNLLCDNNLSSLLPSSKNRNSGATNSNTLKTLLDSKTSNGLPLLTNAEKTEFASTTNSIYLPFDFNSFSYLLAKDKLTSSANFLACSSVNLDLSTILFSLANSSNSSFKRLSNTNCQFMLDADANSLSSSGISIFNSGIKSPKDNNKGEYLNIMYKNALNKKTILNLNNNQINNNQKNSATKQNFFADSSLLQKISTSLKFFDFDLIPSVQALHIGSGTYNTITINGKTYALLTKEQLQEHSYPLIGVYYENYNCDNSTGYWTSKVLTTGKHTQQFNFSGQVAYAHNIVQSVPTTLNYKFNDFNEDVNISVYGTNKGPLPIQTIVNENNSFGFIFNLTEIIQNFTSRSLSFDNRIFIQIDTSEDYTQNGYKLERQIPNKKKYEVGYLTKRAIDFSSIFNKYNNLYLNITIKTNETICLNPPICTINVVIPFNLSIQVLNDFNYSFNLINDSWIIEFYNLFDLDPEFIDYTFTNWSAGTFNQTRSDGNNVTLDFNFGDGKDGNLVVTAMNTIINNYTFVVNKTIPAGSFVIGVNDSTEFNDTNFGIGTEILIIQIQNGSNITYGSGKAGTYEFARIANISYNNITLEKALKNNYTSGIFNQSASNGGSNATQIVRVPNYFNVTINSGASITAPAWSGWQGGIIAFRAQGLVNVSGHINASYLGYRGGYPLVSSTGTSGESYDGFNSSAGRGAPSAGNPIGGGMTTAGGGGGSTSDEGAGGGGGGGHSGGGGGGGGGGTGADNGGGGGLGGKTGVSGGGGGGGGAGGFNGGSGGSAGSAGADGGGGGGVGGSAGDGIISGYGGDDGGSSGGGGGGGGGGIVGSSDLSTIFFGGGGGAGGMKSAGTGVGGSGGGGIIFIAAKKINVTSRSTIQANGSDSQPTGGSANGRGGAGAGGTIWLSALNISINDSSLVTAGGGRRNTGGTILSGSSGGGGVGRIRIDYSNNTKIKGEIDPESNWNGTNPLYYEFGNFTSRVFDAGETVTFDSIIWANLTPLNTNLTLRTRTSADGVTFSNWLTHTNSPSVISQDSTKRYIQYLAVFNTTNISITPYLLNVTISYTPLYPIINKNYTIPTYPMYNRNVTIVANVTDGNFTILYVNFTLYAPNGSIINFTNTSRGAGLSGDIYNASFNLTSNGTWYWNVTVYDSDGFIINSSSTGQIILMSISEGLNMSNPATSAPVAVSGHINLSNNTNVSRNIVNLFIDEGKLYLNLSKTEFNGTGWEFGISSNLTINTTNMTLIANNTGQYPNQTGNFTSQVIDTRTGSNFTFISWKTDAPYQMEIGKATYDGNSISSEEANKFGFINTSGLVLLYHFNNESAYGEDNSLVRDFSPELNPEKSNHSNGTLIGGKYNFSNNKFGAAGIELNGSGSGDTSDEYINTTLRSDPSLVNFSASVWIYPRGYQVTSRTIIAQADGTGTGRPWFTIDGSDTSCVGGASDEVYSSFGGTNQCSGQTAPLNQWTYLVVTGEKTSSTWTIRQYFNAQLVSTTSSISVESANGNFIIGNRKQITQPFNGTIDEVSIWNRSLSSAEILNLYKRGALRLNLSVRSCDDSACSGESFSGDTFFNASGIKLNETITPINRYFQYRFVFNTNDTNYTPVLYNVTINYTTLATDSFGNYNYTFSAPTEGTYIVKVNSTWADTIPGESLLPLKVGFNPRINASLNNLSTDFLQGKRVNMTANVTDDIGLSFCMFIDNQTLANGAKNFYNKSVTGTDDQCSQNYTIALSGGNVINFTVIVNDTTNNLNQSQQIITVASADTCSCPSSGDWGINCADNCVITSNCNMQGNNVYAYSTGTLTINALVYNFNRFATHGCNVVCIRQGGCFG